MNKILKWIKDHLPRWFDLSHNQPWEPPVDDKENTQSKPLSKWR